MASLRSAGVVFLASSFAAKYPQGGGNFSVPVQWAQGLRALGVSFYWLELLASSGSRATDLRRVRIFQRRMRELGLGDRYLLLLGDSSEVPSNLAKCEFFGLQASVFEAMLGGPNVLLNLCASVRQPLTARFERRIFCDLDPGELPYWMQEMELGQSDHHEFWTIGLNLPHEDCTLPRLNVPWKTFFPLVAVDTLSVAPKPVLPRFTTVGQWYWKNDVPLNGKWHDFSKGAMFEKFMEIPRLVPEGHFELAMNIPKDDPVRGRLRENGWHLVSPHQRTRTPGEYLRYLQGALAEFTSVKGIDTHWKTGWISDRAAMFLALGRPVITEDTGASKFLPTDQGLFLTTSCEEARDAARAVLADWSRWSRKARELAEAYFSAEQNLRRILA